LAQNLGFLFTLEPEAVLTDMGMRMRYNARAGIKYRTPESAPLKAFLKSKSNFEVEFMLTCDRIGVSRKLFRDYSVEDLLKLSDGELQGKGLTSSQAAILLERIRYEKGQGKEAMGAGIRDLLIKMLQHEDTLRLSDEVQQRYAEQPDDWAWKWKVTDDVQKQVCKEFGFVDSLTEGLDLLRSSMSLCPGDAEVKMAAHYLRHNIHTTCPLLLCKKTPDIELHTLNGSKTSLDSMVKTGKATVIIAGSHT